MRTLRSSACLLLLIGCTSIEGEQLAADYYRLANAYYEIGRYDESIEYYIEALRFDPNLDQAEYNLIRARIEDGQYQQAIEQLQRQLEQTPDNLILNETLAYALYLSDQSEEALRYYRISIDTSEYRVSTLYNIALILHEQDEYEEALEALERAYQVDAEDVELVYLYAELLYGVEDEDALSGEADTIEKRIANAYVVANEYRVASAAESPDATAAEISAEEKERRRIRALELYLDVGNNDNATVGQQIRVAEVFENEERYADAMRFYDRVLRDDAENSTARFARARLLLTSANEPAEGLRELERSFEDGFSDGRTLRDFLDNETVLERERIDVLIELYEIELPPSNIAPEEVNADESVLPDASQEQ